MKVSCSIYLLLPSLLLGTSGCKSLFPEEDKRTQNRWQSYEEVEGAFARIVPHQTTLADLRAMGYTPEITPNVQVLTYLEVMRRFLPNPSITKEDLQQDVLRCIQAKDGCQAYELDLDVYRSKRHGNLFLDVFGFKKRTHVTGWKYNALVLVQNDIVTYKIRSGTPSIDREEKKTKPLGPLQELDGVLGRTVTGFR